jgi:hypothetical protein
MLTTEDEAKTKRCHASFAASTGITTDGSIMSTSAPMVHHSVYGGSYAVQTASAPLCCIGSACMAWRWVSFDDAVGRYRMSESDYRAKKPGFCGLAGRP